MPDYRKVSTLLDLSLASLELFVSDLILDICDDVVHNKDALHSRDTRDKMEEIAEVSEK